MAFMLCSFLFVYDRFDKFAIVEGSRVYVTYVDSNHVERGECDSLYKAGRPGGRVACTAQEGKGGRVCGQHQQASLKIRIPVTSNF